MSPIRNLVAAPAIGVLALTLAACSGESAADPAASASSSATAGEPATVSYTWNREVSEEDAEVAEYEETTVEVPVNPETIVVFDMASLDTIGTLGGEVAGAPLDNVPDYLADFLADDAFNSGSLFEADLLEIEAQQPDLIIIGGRSSGLYDDLSEIAPTIDTSISGSFEDTLVYNTEFFGTLLGAEDEAAEILAGLQDGIAEVNELTAEAGTGLGVMINGGSLSALSPSDDPSNGRNARGGLIYDVFGVVPVVDDIASATHGEPISFEFLLEHDPDYLFVMDRDAAIGTEDAQSAAEVLDNEIVAQTTAAQEDQIVYLDATAWYVVFGGLTTTQIMIDDMMQIAG